MRDKPNDPHRLDVAAFARAQARLDGHMPLPRFKRLAQAIQPGAPDAQVTWSVAGSFRQPAGREPLMHLRLRADAEVVLTCQRCLEPLRQAVRVDQRLRFVATEAQAEELDEQLEDEDVLALPARLDLIELLEDELILALPIVPRHENCPVSLPSEWVAQPAPADLSQTDSSEETPAHPFAALAVLRRGDKDR